MNDKYAKELISAVKGVTKAIEKLTAKVGKASTSEVLLDPGSVRRLVEAVKPLLETEEGETE